MAPKNPTEYWSEYNGTFSIELTPGAPKHGVPKMGTTIEENIVYIRNGRVKKVLGGVQLCVYGQSFYYPYSMMKAIRNGDGNLLWQNNEYR